MRNNPLIFAGCAMKMPKAKPARTICSTNPENALPTRAAEQKGDLLICDLYQHGTNSVHDLRVVNADAKYHSGNTPEKCLQEAERAKKRMYLEACLQQRRHFSPIVG